MSPAVAVVGAAADVRDVVETFRRFGVRAPGWEKTLRRALAELTTDYATLTSAPLVTDMVISADFRTRGSAQASGEFVVQGAVAPPGDGVSIPSNRGDSS
jgi:hypothetical protein